MTAPGRTLKSSFEILKHTFSILKEESPTVIITVQRKYIEGGYSGFDIPVFQLSPISVKRLGVEALELKARLPFLFYPWKSFQLLLNRKRLFLETLENVPEDILLFCEERGITLRIMTE